MEKKPNVFVNKINKVIHNNENVYFSQGEKIENEEQKNTTNFELSSKTIEQKIKEILILIYTKQMWKSRQKILK